MRVANRWYSGDAVRLEWDDTGGICCLDTWTRETKWRVRVEPGLPFGGISPRRVDGDYSADGLFMGLYKRKDGRMAGGYTIVASVGGDT
jgi:hypothetical protein